MKIAIFGGCFNPCHIMHKQIALDLLEKNYCDKVIYVPASNKYDKKGLADDIHRLNMLKIMCKGNERLEVDDFELYGDLKYTYQTLDHFSEVYKGSELYFILGYDNLFEFKTWKRYTYVLSNYKLLVIARNDINREFLESEFNEYLNNIIFTLVKPKKISSTNIREELKKHRHSDLIEKEVLDYVIKNKLYI
ncbi:MAG: nicotinate (nicotinamide) nucleotide adenylyltransferase [Bdellovibrionota bacterium]